jgi:hypothetical protein
MSKSDIPLTRSWIKDRAIAFLHPLRRPVTWACQHRLLPHESGDYCHGVGQSNRLRFTEMAGNANGTRQSLTILRIQYSGQDCMIMKRKLFR